jgi:hypothetical protein
MTGYRATVSALLIWAATGVEWAWRNRRAVAWGLLSPLLAIAWAVLFLTHAFVAGARPVTGPALDDLVKGPRP